MEYEGSRGKWTSTLFHTTINGQNVWGRVQEVFRMSKAEKENYLALKHTFGNRNSNFTSKKTPQQNPKYNVVEGKQNF